jgi:transposase
MLFDELLDRVLEMLQRRGRVSYRALKRQFDLDDAYLEDLKAEIIEVHRLAVDQDGTMLVWRGLSMVRRDGLRDEQWEQSKHWLPGRAETVCGTAQDNRLFVAAVLSRSRAGMPWRDLPARFGHGKHSHRRHRRGADSGVWQRVFAHLAGDAARAYAMIDAPIVRIHQHAAGATGGTGTPRALGAAKADCPPKDTPHARRGAPRLAGT